MLKGLRLYEGKLKSQSSWRLAFFAVLAVMVIARACVFAQDTKSYVEAGKKYLLHSYHKQKEALASFKKAYDIKADDPEIQYWYGRALYENRQFAKAKDILEQAVEKRDNDADTHAFLAYTYGRIGNGNILSQAAYTARAMKQLKKAMSINPNMDGYHIAWGIGFHYFKQYGKAEESFKKAMAINPKNAWTYSQLARVYLAEGKKDEAKKLFEKAKSIAEKDVKSGMKDDSVPRGIALYYEEAGMFEEALPYAKLALAWNPKDLSLMPAFSIKKLISRLEQEKKTGNKLIKDVGEEL